MLDSFIAHKILNKALLEVLHEATPTVQEIYFPKETRAFHRLPDSAQVVTNIERDKRRAYLENICYGNIGDYKVQHYLQELLKDASTGKPTFVEEVMAYDFLDDKIFIK